MTSYADIAEAVIDLEKRFASLRTLIGTLAPQKPKKARAENPWITFNKRVDTLLTENDRGFNGLGDAKKFAAHLKERQSYNWTDADILNERQAWDRAHPPSCSMCHEDPTGNLDDHRKCILDYTRTLIEAGQKVPNPVETWMRSSGIKVPTELANKVEEKRPVGRPKMTEQEKAAKKAQREAAHAAKKVAELTKPLFQIDSDVLLDDLESVASVSHI